MNRRAGRLGHPSDEARGVRGASQGQPSDKNNCAWDVANKTTYVITATDSAGGTDEARVTITVAPAPGG